jgi:opacity protein-like surface antigen
MNKHLLSLSLILAVAAQPAAAKSPWNFSTSLSVKETFDNNVFLQDTTALAHRSSMVSAFTPSLTLTYQETPAFKAIVSYAPEVVFYHSYSSEDYTAHRATLNLSGKSGDTAWEVNNAVTGIDGNDRGPTFDTAHGGDIPALGGIPLRDRRDAIIYRNSVKVTQTIGKWFVRPVFTSYVHDFQTEQSSAAGYENYIDRSEVNGGLDIGYEARKKTWLVLGYRYGYQHQNERFGVASPYSSNYHRILAGVEGTPTDWLKLNVLAGPDIRIFQSTSLPSTFDKNEFLWYVDASATVTLGKRNTVTVLLTRYEQPAFSSHSVYEDIVYSVGWRHQCNDKFAATVGLKINEGDWQAPINRNDVIYTPSVGVSYTFNKHISTDLSYSYDAVCSEVVNTTGREFTRHLVSLGAKFTF